MDEEKEKQPGKPRLYFPKERGKDRPAEKEQAMQKPEQAKPSANYEIIKRHIEEQTAKQKEIPEIPKSKIGLADGKMSVSRTKEQAAKISQFDFSSMKQKITSKLEGDKRHAETYPIDRCTTGVEGLDEMMEGGFVKNSSNIVAGGSGSGKSIFCMQFLVNGIEKCREPGVYISFEEDKEKIFRDMSDFGWDLEGKIKKGQLAIVHYTPEQVGKVLETGAGTVRDVVESTNAKRVVIDSITAFLLLHETELEKRKNLLRLFETLEKWGCTALLISEHEQDPEKHESAALEFSVDGIIILYNIKKGDVRTRALEVYKMRATEHTTKIIPMQVTNRGISLFPDASVF